jgi:hypothetical protein
MSLSVSGNLTCMNKQVPYGTAAGLGVQVIQIIFYLELERLRPVNLVQSVQEGRDGTGETAWVSEAFTLSLSASAP